jgi:drug/metabolite transporter (DMT)-like permease
MQAGVRERAAHASAIQTAVLTAAAMLAFAANSLLCRLALQQGSIDPASFSSIRIVAGAVTLALILKYRAAPAVLGKSDWISAAMLFVYVAFFSFAYVTLSAGTGALILFGTVQFTMLGAGLRAGERFGAVAWSGLALAAAGLVWLVLPGIAAPSPVGAVLMAIAGAAWGVYSLRGRSAGDPLAATTGNFMRAVPFALVLSLLFAGDAKIGAAGVALAIVSGAVTSGIGYAVWYAALRGLSGMRAAAVQLSVPLIAALGGVLFLSEGFTLRLALASAAIIGGLAIVLTSRIPKARP